MTKRMIIMVIALLIVFGGIFGFNVWRTRLIRHRVETFVPPPVVISTTKAVAQRWQPTLSAVGSLLAINGVNVSSEVSGTIIAIHFQSGQMVQEGDPLVHLDDSSDIQDLKNNQAQLNLDRVTFKRQAALYRSAAVSKSDYDQALAAFQQSQAAVNKSLVAISKKNIRAPFSGKIGIRQVNLGQYVNPGDPLVSLQSLDPLYVNFSLPEQYLRNISLDQKISISIDAYPGKNFFGKITAIDALVTPATRSINIQGTLLNKDHQLYPGVFASVTVYLPEEKSVITVPQTAVTYSLFGNTVFIVKEGGKDKRGKPILRAYEQQVTLGEMKNNKVIIKKGVNAGDEVVTSGQNKLTDGVHVTINNSVQLSPRSKKMLHGG